MKFSLLVQKHLSFTYLCGFVLSGLFLTGTPLWASQNHSVSEFANMPINITEEGVIPKVVIATSNDHQLYFKAYNDFSDLDGDGIPETTYKHSINYYGYFDSYKCYAYNTTAQRFEPDTITTDKYCNAGQAGQWSGNFLNWVSMSRIDAIRKVLFGGHRRVDLPTETVLERSYLPHDAHSWAKYYAGSDLPQLTPFTRADYNCDEGNTGDGKCLTNGVLDRKKIGVTFGNTSDVDMGLYKNVYSEGYAVPPLIKAVKGNHSLWASNHRWQITWRIGHPIENRAASNFNDSDRSGIHAYSNNPDWIERLGEGDYVARVQVCVDNLHGKEKCKRYPGGNYKPIGLLQSYGDNDQMQFGMVAGSYNQHASGGVLIRNVKSLKNEVNVDTDGTFPLVATYAGGPMENNKAEGLINAWSLFRIIGYDGSDGTYSSSQGDNCPEWLSAFSDVTKPNVCRNWGNPFSEIYYQAINYLAGGGVIGPYRDNSSNIIPGLPVPQNFVDCLDDGSYCANLFVIALNSSSSSYDYDELDHTSYGPSKIWDPAVLPGDKSTRAMTDAVGKAEGIHGNSYYVGEINIGSGTDDQLCTGKKVTSLGSVGGICPESPRLGGSYRIGGLAYYAHVEDIRPENASGNRGLKSKQTVDTFAVAMATGVPEIKIPNPADINGNPAVTILPACRNTSLNPAGNCALVDFKIVTQEVTAQTASGTFYINWEDSEQGGDYDQDMWGTLDYHLDVSTNIVKITTQVHTQSTPSKMGFGYVIDGTTDDGFHAHSGINGFTYVETIPVETGSPDCSPPSGCVCRNDHGICDLLGSGPSIKNYSLGSSTTKKLEDPLWYAAKYGGFIDSNNNKLPDLESEWDKVDNKTGEEGPDGIPDNYFYASNPQELEDSLTRVLNAILERTSSGTAAAVVSSNVRGEGALFQAYYEPRRKDADFNEASWLGTVQALWLDKHGYTRQDCSPTDGNNIDSDGKCIPITKCEPDGKLDNYCVDQVVETYYDDLLERTRMRIYDSDDPSTFTARSMQGVVTGYAAGAVTMEPNSMEGMADFSANTLTLTPYELRGTVVAYDPASGNVTMAIAAGDWEGPNGGTYDNWNVNVYLGAGAGFSLSSITLAENPTASFTVSPPGPWIIIDDILILTTKNVVGASGQRFSPWTVSCLEAATASGTISGNMQLNNSGTSSGTVVTDSGDFVGCERARLETYNLRGKEGEEFAEWQVANLQTNHGGGTSQTSLTLTNQDPLSFTVTPTDNWLSIGDQVLVSSFKTTSKELYQIGYLWNARERLYLPGLLDWELAKNRDYSSSADKGRYIMTWIDSNHDNKVDLGLGEYRAFEKQMFDDFSFPVSHTFFDVASKEEAANLIDFIRGIEIPGSRTRTIKYSPEDTDKNVMRLGDIVNSTPTTVGVPAEAFDLLYRDYTYRGFRQLYKQRRIVVYAGGNDGLVHAFNGGFYNVDTDGKIEYSTKGYKNDGVTPATEHPLGSELWAYAPMNLQSHLQWLKSTGYKDTHVSYVDAKPRVFDAKIFNEDDDHPNGWGTVMVVGMNLGGGKMTFDIYNDNDPSTSITTSRHSAYVVFDITNPEKAPVLLGEITIPDESFTSVYPAVIAGQDIGTNLNCDAGTTACNTWFLMFGNGPNDIFSYVSNQSAKMYLFDLKQLIHGVPSPDLAVHPDGCTVLLPDTSAYNVVSCDTNVANSFMGTPSVVDWGLDFVADTAYFGLVGGFDSASGQVMRFELNNSPSLTDWTKPVSVFNSQKPIYAQIIPSVDNLNNRWIFFGSGRYFSMLDKTSTITQRIYGIKDHDGSFVPENSLLNVTNTEVFTDGTLLNPLLTLDGTTAMTTFKEVEKEIDEKSLGWFLDLPPILGTVSDPSTRNVTRSSLAGGVLFTNVFQPSNDPCAGEGFSRLYGLYYKTGTGYPKIPPIFGSSVKTVNGEVKYLTNRFLDLGRGAAAPPTLHSGSGRGDNSLSVFSQLSTGEMVQSDAETVLPIRSGRTSWRDQ